MATQTQEKEDLSNIRFVGVRDRREVFTPPPHERMVLERGQQVVDVTRFQQIVLEPGGNGHQPRNHQELEQLRDSPMNVANQGELDVFKEINLEDTPEDEDVGQETDTSEAGEAANTGSAQGAYEDVGTKAEAAEVLMGDPFNVPRESLLTENDNLSVKKCREVGEQVGVEFPEL